MIDSGESAVSDTSPTRPANPERSRFLRRLALVAGAALVVRVAYIVLFKRDEPAIGDAIYYSTQAIRIAEGRWFEHPFSGGPAADHPPLTALTMAPVALLLGPSLLIQRFAMAIVGVLVVIGVGVLGRSVSGSSRVGLIAAAIAAVYPNFWINDGVVMSETIAMATLVTFFVVLYRFRDDFSPGRMAVLGALCGIAVLARAESALLLPLIVLPTVLLTKPGPLWRRLGVVALAGAVSLAVVAPWTAYNLSRFEKPVLLSSNDGLTILGANCDSTYYGDGVGLWSFECAFGVPGPDPDTADQSEISAAFRKAGIEYISNHKTRLPVVAISRVGRIWGVYAPGQMVAYSEGDLERTGEGREAWASWWGYAMWWVLVPLAAYGAVILRRGGALVLPLVMTGVVVTVTAVAFYGLVRFRIPAEIAVVVLAAAAVDHLVGRRSRSLGTS